MTKAERIAELNAAILRSKRRRGGLKGGPARAAKLGPEGCKEESRRIANIRWGNKTPEERSAEFRKGRTEASEAERIRNAKKAQAEYYQQRKMSA